jgi:hypothetical protein
LGRCCCCRHACAAIDDGHRSPSFGERLGDFQAYASRPPCWFSLGQRGRNGVEWTV